MPDKQGPPTDAEKARRLAEAAERSRRAYEEIRLWGDPALRSRATPVGEFGAALRRQADHMIEVMQNAPGCGLAAPQIGSLRRLVVYQLPGGIEEGPPPPRALVNPKIVDASEEREVFLEGCLSIPRIYVAVERPSWVVVEATDPAGEPVEVLGEGFHASVLQHEIDHLDGVLLADRLERPDRKAFLRAVREAAAAGWPGEEILVGAAAELIRPEEEPAEEKQPEGVE
jgi:peptide deformylase